MPRKPPSDCRLLKENRFQKNCHPPDCTWANGVQRQFCRKAPVQKKPPVQKKVYPVGTAYPTDILNPNLAFAPIGRGGPKQKPPVMAHPTDFYNPNLAFAPIGRGGPKQKPPVMAHPLAFAPGAVVPRHVPVGRWLPKSTARKSGVPKPTGRPVRKSAGGAKGQVRKGVTNPGANGFPARLEETGERRRGKDNLWYTVVEDVKKKKSWKLNKENWLTDEID